jgi:hypothetical protein
MIFFDHVTEKAQLSRDMAVESKKYRDTFLTLIQSVSGRNDLPVTVLHRRGFPVRFTRAREAPS